MEPRWPRALLSIRIADVRPACRHKARVRRRQAPASVRRKLCRWRTRRRRPRLRRGARRPVPDDQAEPGRTGSAAAERRAELGGRADAPCADERPMTAPASGSVTELLRAWGGGDERALEQLLPLVEAELRRLARGYMARERRGHTLQTTALVNEAFVRLVDARQLGWHDRAHL